MKNEKNKNPLYTSLTLRAHRVRTRLVLPPMASQTADERGYVTPATLAHYARLVGPRTGVAFVEYTYVHPWGRSEPNQLGLSEAGQVEGLAQLAALIRERGALPGLQLTHAGGKTEAALIGRAPLGASAVAIPAHGGDLPAPAPMTEAELAEVAEAFEVAALRAEAAGFAVIEIHAAHGYFFNQWLSPITNQRTDAHGGSMAARSALLLDLVRRLRAVLRPETLLSIRFPGQDRLDGGLTLDETVPLARALAEAGMDLFDVSSGLGGWRRGRGQRGEGYLVPDAAELRARAGVTVIGVGGIQSHAYACQALLSGQADMLAVGRAVLENPDWAREAADSCAA